MAEAAETGQERVPLTIGSEVGLVGVGVFHKHWERTRAAGINLSDILLLSTALFLDFCSAAGAASG